MSNNTVNFENEGEENAEVTFDIRALRWKEIMGLISIDVGFVSRTIDFYFVLNIPNLFVLF